MLRQEPETSPLQLPPAPAVCAPEPETPDDLCAALKELAPPPAPEAETKSLVQEGLTLLSYPARKALALALRGVDKMAAEPETEAGFVRGLGRKTVGLLPVIGKWKRIGDMRAEYQHAKETGDTLKIAAAREKAETLTGELGFDLATAGRGGLARDLVTVRRLNKVKDWPIIRSIPGMKSLPTLDPVAAIAALVAWGRGQVDLVEGVYGTKPEDLEK